VAAFWVLVMYRGQPVGLKPSPMKQADEGEGPDWDDRASRDMSFRRHLWALLVRHAQTWRRDVKGFIYTVMWPVVFTLLGTIILWVTSKQALPTEPALALSLSQYNPGLRSDANPLYYNASASGAAILSAIPSASSLPLVPIPGIQSTDDMMQVSPGLEGGTPQDPYCTSAADPVTLCPDPSGTELDRWLVGRVAVRRRADLCRLLRVDHLRLLGHEQLHRGPRHADLFVPGR
jgi:hypothetical protein